MLPADVIVAGASTPPQARQRVAGKFSIAPSPIPLLLPRLQLPLDAPAVSRRPTVLEICPTSNLLTGALADEDALRDTIRAFTDGDDCGARDVNARGHHAYVV